ncbi:hypothetical protein [Lederbergia lenta]|uniref:hypothetical protein n=1 Tax=Lederbergia lenta TaxID=1467 RepID=UPI00203AE08C|nr:hypothetical protein [Lederbergia lenta]MCM3110019.1 hypothetical protein [Lederbergia lenta]
MAVITTKTVRDFKGKGFYNPDTSIFTNEKDGEETLIPDVLSTLAKDGELISINIKHEESTQQTLDEIIEEDQE